MSSARTHGSRVPQGRRAKESDTPANCARVAARPETLDRPDSGHDEAGATERNLGAVNVELTPDKLREIDTAASKIEVHGARLPEAVLQYSNR
jgi:hypothetical protein